MKLSETYKKSRKLFQAEFDKYQADKTVKNGKVIHVDFKSGKKIEVKEQQLKKKGA